MSRHSILIFATLISAAIPFRTTVASQPVQFDFSSIDIPSASVTNVFGINPEGSIVGRYAIGSFFHSFVLTNGALTSFDLPVPPFGIAGTSGAQGITADDRPVIGIRPDDVASRVDALCAAGS